MASESTSVAVSALSCAGCRASMKGGMLGLGSLVSALQKSAGRCPACGDERFDATFTMRRTFSEGPSGEQVAARLLFGGLAGRALVGYGEEGKYVRDFAIADVAGADILEKMALPPRDTIDWLLSILKEAAKANLRTNQGLCLECGEIYMKGFAGPTAGGYCSLICQRRHQKNLTPVVGSDEPAAPAAARAIDCPHCGRKVKVKPGGKCMYCGRPVAPPLPT